MARRAASANPAGWSKASRISTICKQYSAPNAPTCSAPLDTIQVGGKLRTITGSRVRQTPANDGFVITVVQPPGVTLDVIDGPCCSDGLNWWRVRAPYGNTNTLVDGWIAEGFPGEYYVEGLTFERAACSRPAARRCACTPGRGGQ